MKSDQKKHKIEKKQYGIKVRNIIFEKKKKKIAFEIFLPEL